MPVLENGLRENGLRKRPWGSGLREAFPGKKAPGIRSPGESPGKYPAEADYRRPFFLAAGRLFAAERRFATFLAGRFFAARFFATGRLFAAAFRAVFFAGFFFVAFFLAAAFFGGAFFTAGFGAGLGEGAAGRLTGGAPDAGGGVTAGRGGATGGACVGTAGPSPRRS